jgi:mono/diheme cytochrome c family protein
MGSRGSWVWFCAAVLSCAIGCAAKKPVPASVATPPAAPAATPATTTAAASSEQLPEGAGRQILMSACVACHGLREVTKFRGFYTRQQWRDIVMTMVDYGAPVSEKDSELLTDSLTANLGKK